jgi:homoserine kinase
MDAMTVSDQQTRGGVKHRLTVRVPGSTSNLGPGFDTLGLALTIYNTVTFDLLEENDPSIPLIQLVGSTDVSLPVDGSNHIFAVLRQELGEDNKEILDRTRITIDSAIPIGSGLGSSGTVTLAAIWAAQRLAGITPVTQQLLESATRIEGHPDNVSPSLLGGFTVSAVNKETKRVLVEELPWPANWHTIFVVPQRSVSTKHARSVLPETVDLQDAVHNVQRSSLLVAAVAKSDGAMLTHALDDKLHEPYRAELVPELTELRQLLRKQPALGCVLSGAGPSIMVVVDSRFLNEVLTVLQDWAATKAEQPRILNLQVDHSGLQATHE